MDGHTKNMVIADEWNFLKSFTNARIALGRAGVSIPLNETLRFKLAHAHARDAVFSVLDVKGISDSLAALDIPSHLVKSQAISREIYLQRPDKGRVLEQGSSSMLKQLNLPVTDVSIIISDGLSAAAVNENAVPFIHRLSQVLAGKYTMAPVVIAEQARVAIADEIGWLLHAKLTVNLIGERPGLSAVNGMGAYITFDPLPGLTDERRNCISNIRPEGLGLQEATDKIYYLIGQAFQLETSGVVLKDKGIRGSISNDMGNRN